MTHIYGGKWHVLLNMKPKNYQKKQRRGRLIFQEREDDEDMTRPDTTKNITTSSTLHQEIRGKQSDMIRCCLRSSSTSLWVQEKLESKFSTFWTQIRTAEIHLTSICYKFCIRTPNGVNLFLLESLSRALSRKIGLTSKFVSSEKRRPKESNPIAETGPEVQEKGAAPPLIGPKGLVRIRVSVLGLLYPFLCKIFVI